MPLAVNGTPFGSAVSVLAMANSTLSDRLVWARNRQRMTQDAVATAAGIAQSSYGDLESGRSKSTRHVATLSSVLRVSPMWLERGSGTPDADSVRETGATYRDAVNETELTMVIDAVETWLSEARLTMTPIDKASLVASLYRMLPTALKEGERLASRSTVVQLLEVVKRAGTNAQGTEGPAAFGAPVRKRESASGGRRAKS